MTRHIFHCCIFGVALCCVSRVYCYDSARSLLYSTATDSTNLQYSRHIDAQQLGISIARVMNLDAPHDASVRLPAGSMFARPDLNVLLMVDGLRIHSAGTGLAPFLERKFSSVTATNSHTLMDLPASKGNTAHESLLQTVTDTLSTAARPALAAGSISSILCSGADRSSFQHNSQLCSGAGFLVAPQQITIDKLQPLFENLEFEAAYDEATKQWALTHNKHLATSALFDVGIPADTQFVQELASLAILKAHLLSVRNDPPEAPQLVAVYISSLKALSMEHGRTSGTLSAARLLLDSALEHVFGGIMEGNQVTKQRALQLTMQIVTGADLHTAPLAAAAEISRRLAGASNATNGTAGNMTLNEITQYQLNLWTGVFLALLVFASIYGVATMDIGRDSLLYAKFQADTTSKVD